MRKTLRFLFVAAAVLAVLATAGGLTVHALSNRRLSQLREVPSVAVSVDRSPASLERGRYLVDSLMGCKDCHGADLGGGVVVDDPALGRLVAPNLTHGAGSVTQGMSPAEWDRAVRHGVGRDGRALVLMPSGDYWSFPDADLAAVIAYVESLPPVDRELPALGVGPLGRVLLVAGKMPLACELLDHDAPRPQAEPGPTRAWGEVLVGACQGCHGRDLGGGPIPGGPPEWPPARNISADPVAGIGSWTEADFRRALTEGLRPDGSALSEVMPWKAYASLSESDRHALWLYLSANGPA